MAVITRKPTASTTRKPTDTPQPWVSPKVARLREVSGHDGPWTNREYEAAFGPPIGPTTDPDPEPPSEVVEAAEARDVALAEFERADETWRDAVSAEDRAHQSAVTWNPKTGQFATDPKAPARLRKAREALKEATGIRDRAAEQLRAATVRWRKLETDWRNELRRAEYDRTAKP